jgi:hypothetical protein
MSALVLISILWYRRDGYGSWRLLVVIGLGPNFVASMETKEDYEINNNNLFLLDQVLQMDKNRERLQLFIQPPRCRF